jgi:hypothetical protein
MPLECSFLCRAIPASVVLLMYPNPLFSGRGKAGAGELDFGTAVAIRTIPRGATADALSKVLSILSL